MRSISIEVFQKIYLKNVTNMQMTQCLEDI